MKFTIRHLIAVILVGLVVAVLFTPAEAHEPKCDEETHYSCGWGKGMTCCWRDMVCCRMERIDGWYCADKCI